MVLSGEAGAAAIGMKGHVSGQCDFKGQSEGITVASNARVALLLGLSGEGEINVKPCQFLYDKFYGIKARHQIIRAILKAYGMRCCHEVTGPVAPNRTEVRLKLPKALFTPNADGDMQISTAHARNISWQVEAEEIVLECPMGFDEVGWNCEATPVVAGDNDYCARNSVRVADGEQCTAENTYCGPAGWKNFTSETSLDSPHCFRRNYNSLAGNIGEAAKNFDVAGVTAAAGALFGQVIQAGQAKFEMGSVTQDICKNCVARIVLDTELRAENGVQFRFSQTKENFYSKLNDARAAVALMESFRSQVEIIDSSIELLHAQYRLTFGDGVSLMSTETPRSGPRTQLAPAHFSDTEKFYIGQMVTLQKERLNMRRMLNRTSKRLVGHLLLLGLWALSIGVRYKNQYDLYMGREAFVKVDNGKRVLGGLQTFRVSVPVDTQSEEGVMFKGMLQNTNFGLGAQHFPQGMQVYDVDAQTYMPTNRPKYTLHPDANGFVPEQDIRNAFGGQTTKSFWNKLGIFRAPMADQNTYFVRVEEGMLNENNSKWEPRSPKAGAAMRLRKAYSTNLM